MSVWTDPNTGEKFDIVETVEVSWACPRCGLENVTDFHRVAFPVCQCEAPTGWAFIMSPRDLATCKRLSRGIQKGTIDIR